MKNLRTAILCAVLALGTLGIKAQKETIPINQPNYNKAKLFNSLPDQILLGTDKLNSLLTLTVGNPVNLQLTENASGLFKGEVVSISNKFDQIRSVVIRSSNFNGAVLTLSKLTSTEGVISYSGRMMSLQHGDLFELKQQGNEYVLIKKNYYDLVNE